MLGNSCLSARGTRAAVYPTGVIVGQRKPTRPILFYWVWAAESTVSSFDVIADVSLTLQNVLTESLSILQPAPPPLAQVHDLETLPAPAPPTLTLFLFDICEDPSARNRARRRDVVPPNVIIRKPPLALMLRYLLTPWSGDRLTDHRILGRVMQTLYDGAIISGTQLAGGLAGSDQGLKITPTLLTLDERSRVWFAIQRRYRISLAYEVRVVNLDSETADSKRPVAARQLDYEEAQHKD